MRNAQNITVTLLTITAVILATLLVSSYVYTEPAYGGQGVGKGGNYIITAGTYNAETDFVYVLDIETEKLSIYYPNINTNALAIGDTVDLAKAFRQ